MTACKQTTRAILDSSDLAWTTWSMADGSASKQIVIADPIAMTQAGCVHARGVRVCF